MSIQRFTQEVKSRGMAKTNRYEVQFNFPNTDSNGSQLATLFCEAVNLPGMSIATQPHRMFGEVREMPYERMFDPVTFSFYVDGDMEVKAAFERWIHLVMNQGTRTMGYYNDYVKPVHIHLINKSLPPGLAGLGLLDASINDYDDPPNEDDYVYTVTLNEAYPKSISTVQLSSESKEIMKVSVTMQYRYWTSSASVGIRPTAAPPIAPQDPAGIITTTGEPELGNTWDPYSPYAP